MKKFIRAGITPRRRRKIVASYADIQNLTWDEKIDYLMDHDYNVNSYEYMKDMAKYCIDEDNLFLARHILDAIDSDPADFYHYDPSMGTMETPTAISDDEDIESIIDLYE